VIYPLIVAFPFLDIYVTVEQELNPQTAYPMDIIAPRYTAEVTVWREKTLGTRNDIISLEVSTGLGVRRRSGQSKSRPRNRISLRLRPSDVQFW
jgi:hypothetical protein